MENKDVKTRNRSKITVIVLTVFLLLCAVACVGTLLTRKDNEVVKEPEQVIVDGAKISVSDEATLRELLLEDAELVIEVTEDIVVDKAMLVNGTKTLTGAGSISMALYVQPYQYMLEVQKGASLIFDGVTIDGNGSSNCVKVEKDAEVTVLSGELTYGCPTVIESFGDVYIKGGSIVDAIGTGVYIHNDANLYMTAGTIRGCVDGGIETATSGYMSISDEAILQDNMEYFVYNRGTCDITGGIFRNAQSDMVYTSGVMNVKYEGEAGGMLEWYDIQGCGLVVGNGGELNVDGLHIKDVGNRAVTTAVGKSVSNISNSLFENTKGDAIYVRTEVNLKNVEIKNSNLSGIMLIQTGKATIDNVTITDTVKDGIQNGGGVVTGKNLVVNNAGRIGVNSYKLNDVAASVTLENVTINGTEKSNGLHVEASTLTVSNAKIYNAGNEGARAQKKGTLNLTNVEIQNSKGHSIASYDAGSKVILKNVKTTGGKRGVGAFGGNVTGTKVTVNSPVEYGVTGSKKSVVEITDLIIKDSGKTGVNANDATINITNATIENPKATAGVNADYAGKVTLKNAEIKFPEGATASVDGVKAVSPATITLEKVNFTNVPGRAVYANGEKAKIAVTDITTTGGKRGIQVFKAGQVEGTNISITSPSEYGISCGDEGSGFNLTNLTITECGKHGLNVYDGAVATATDVTITKPAKLGAFVGNKGQLTMNNVSISESGETGIINDNATLSVTKGLVEKANGNGVHTYKGGITKLTDCDVKDSANYNIRVDNENSKYVLSNVTTTGGKRGIQIYKGGAVEGNKVTITSPSQYGISCGDEGSSLVMKDLTVENCGTTGVNVYDSAVGTVTNATITKTGEQAGFVGNKGKLTFNSVTISKTDKTALMNSNGTLNVTGGSLTKAGEDSVHTFGGGLTNLTNYKITDSTNHNIRVDNVDSKCVLKDVTTTDGKRGIQIWKGGTVEGSNVTITSPSDMAITCGDEGSSFKIKGLTVNRKGSIGVSSGNIAVNVYGGAVAEVEDGLIEYPGTIGANVEKATLTLKGTFEVVKPGDRGIKNVGGTVEAGTATVKVDNPKSFGVSTNAFVKEVEGQDDVVTAGTTTIKTLNVNDAEGYSAMTVNGVGTVVTVNGGTISDSKGHGVNASDGKLILNNVKITDAGEYGIEAQKDSTIELEGVEITDGKRGIQIKDGGHVKGGTVTISSPSEYGLASASASSFEIANLSVSESGSHAVNVYGNSTAKVTTKLTITDAGSNGIACSGSDTTFEVEELEVKHSENKTVSTVSHGVNVYDGAELTVNGGTITNPGGHGANVDSSAQLTLKNNVVITEANGNGVNADNGAKLTLTNVGINNSTNSNLYAKGNSIVTINGKLTTNGSKNSLAIYGGADVKKGENGGNIEINSPTNAGIRCYDDGSSLNIDDLKVYVNNKGTYGVELGNKGQATIRSGEISSSNSHGIFVTGYGQIELTNVTISNSKGSNLYVENNATAIINGTLTTNGGTNSLAIYKVATVKKGENGGNITINSPTESGIRCYDDGSSLTIDNLNVYMNNNGKHGIELGSKGHVTVGSGEISQSGQHGISVNNATLTLTGTLNINSPKLSGIVNAGGTVTGNTATVTVTTPGEYGVTTTDGGSTTIQTVNVSSTVAYAAVKAEGVNTVTTLNNGTITSTAANGIECRDQAHVTMEGGNISSPSGHGVYVLGTNDSQKIPKTKATLTGVTIENAGFNGVFTEQYGEVELTNVNINNSANSNLYVNTNSIATINGTLNTQGAVNSIAIYNKASVQKGDNGGSITIDSPTKNGIRLYNLDSNLNIDTLNVNNSGEHALEVSDQAQATINGGTLTVKTGGSGNIFGVKAHNKARVTLNSVEIHNPVNHAMVVWSGSSVDGSNVSVSKAKYHGISCGDSNSEIDITGLTLTNCGEHGLRVYSSAQATLKGNVQITSPGLRGIVNDGGTVLGSEATVNITSSGNIGLSASGASQTTIGTLNVTGAKATSGVNASGSATITITKGGTISKTTGWGVNANGTSILKLTNCMISESSTSDINVEGSGATIELTGMTKGTHYTTTSGYEDKIINK